LQALDGAASRLRLLQMDLLDPASVRAAVEGARGVFHLASPVTLQLPQDPAEIDSFLVRSIPLHGGTGESVMNSPIIDLY
jgi:uncharacterized protein YbjT (DUF2867 family)